MLCGADLHATSALPATFEVGEGETCVNVTVQVLRGLVQVGGVNQAVHVETRCLEPGHHEYNHTVEDVHSVQVVGYVNSTIRQGAGGTTPFVVGECTDAFIRISTTSAPSTVSWLLDDDGHNGPWVFTSPAVLVGTNVHEYQSCMFDNRFSLSLAPGMEWEGTVEVRTCLRNPMFWLLNRL